MKLWLDAPDGRVGSAIAATLCDADSGQRQDLAAEFGDANALVLARVFGPQDVAPIITAAVHSGFSGPVILMSSLAERRYERWSLSEPSNWADEPWPDDSYGVAKRRARERLQEAGIGPVVSLLLPALLSDAGPRAPWSTLLQDTKRDGFAKLPGTGQQLSGAISLADVALVTVSLVSQAPSRSATYQVGPPCPTPVTELVEAFLLGAGVVAPLRAWPHASHRGPLAPVDEVCNADRLRLALPELQWQDPRGVCRRLGARLAAAS